MTKAPALQPGYFDALYASKADPWAFETSAYEYAKYAATLAALGGRHYANAIEVGCSIGVLTARLAPLCASLLATDVATAALDTARQRCAVMANVRFDLSTLPDRTPEGRYDLILLSEVLYYFDSAGIAAVAASVRAMALPGADILLVHWLGPTPDYPHTGDEAVAAFKAALGHVDVRLQRRTPEYRLDLLAVLPDPR